MVFYMLLLLLCLLRKRSGSGSSCDCRLHFHNSQTPGGIGAPAAGKAGLAGVTCCSQILPLDSRPFVMNDTVGTRGGSILTWWLVAAMLCSCCHTRHHARPCRPVFFLNFNHHCQWCWPLSPSFKSLQVGNSLRIFISPGFQTHLNQPSTKSFTPDA